MTTDTIGRFERSLAALEVTSEVVPASAASERIGAAVDDPAVGTALPFEGVSLPDAVTAEPTPTELEDAVTGVTPAAFAVAEHGTVAIGSSERGEEPVSLYPDRHVAVVAGSDVVADLGDGFDRLLEGDSRGRGSVVFATGRSATADMGGLVHGVHGPGEGHVVVLEDR
ncbi:L-lactate dehydrogenase complex protein LldG [Halobiforma haloterrestris]|uniref:L-lactate dehydrogenase complex protein LldG n=1 Tax=Natronobacterium haloterrestre TaxID=148448 RepID=A0A1I1G6L4_NATHA|nr:LUD domain-containing protein [Halobiforma haloterrestris]SFC05488.1 L-lactate dehydrogenase complex protein LldG [Halobiforma haloterrestris]